MDKFGATPEELKIRMMAMAEDLEPYTLDVIADAFVIYRRENSTIPTSEKMIKICDKLRGKKTSAGYGFKSQSRFIQVVYAPGHDSKQALAEYLPHERKTPHELQELHGVGVSVAYRKEK